MPVLHLLAGPNGSGKTTFYEQVLGPATGLPFVNADVMARELWPGQELERAYDAAKRAEQRRDEFIARRRSFIAETVFSHPSKIDLIRRARFAGYLVTVHAIVVPLALSIRRVEARVKHGGHDVPLNKQRERYKRLWPLIAQALRASNEGYAYDNSSAKEPYRIVAHFENGQPVDVADWPAWAELRRLL